MYIYFTHKNITAGALLYYTSIFDKHMLKKSGVTKKNEKGKDSSILTENNS